MNGLLIIEPTVGDATFLHPLLVE